MGQLGASLWMSDPLRMKGQKRRAGDVEFFSFQLLDRVIAKVDLGSGKDAPKLCGIPAINRRRTYDDPRAHLHRSFI
jgi:hypothetical protein